jgi:hypothetical protein
MAELRFQQAYIFAFSNTSSLLQTVKSVCRNNNALIEKRRIFVGTDAKTNNCRKFRRNHWIKHMDGQNKKFGG